MVKALTALLGSMGFASVIYMVFILTRLSSRLGEVTGMRPYYQGFHLASICLIVSLMARLLRGSVCLAPERAPQFLSSDVFYLLSYYLPLALGMTISLIVTLRYWEWLLKE